MDVSWGQGWDVGLSRAPRGDLIAAGFGKIIFWNASDEGVGLMNVPFGDIEGWW